MLSQVTVFLPSSIPGWVVPKIVLSIQFFFKFQAAITVNPSLGGRRVKYRGQILHPLGCDCHWDSNFNWAAEKEGERGEGGRKVQVLVNLLIGNHTIQDKNG